MNHPEKYKDMEKWRRAVKRQKKRYYNSTHFPRKNWTIHDDNLVLNSPLTDKELSKVICHTVHAIQIRRSRLKAKQDKNT